MDSILSFRGITKHFPGVKALDSVSFDVKKGEVHSIVGENGAGKSTLIKVIGGVYIPEAGEMFIGDERADFETPMDSLEKGIRIVHQELNLVEKLTVAENLLLGNEETFFTQSKKDNQQALEMLEQVGISLDPKMKVSRLSIGKKQMLDIAKAASSNPSILILDEPTSSLSKGEISQLFSIIRSMAERGITVIYISHKLDEVMELSDSITVLRDGKHIETCRKTEVTPQKLVQLMVARDMESMFPEAKGKPEKEVVFSVENISRTNTCHDCSFKLYDREILGFFGLMGAGRTELMQTILGVTPFETGKVNILGKEFSELRIDTAIREGVGFITEDRRSSGIVGCRSVKENMTLPNLNNLSKTFGWVDSRKEKEIVADYGKKLNVRYAGLNQLIKYLSGGNQQKVIVAKWLMSQPKILIMDEPTRGIDVGAKQEIYELIQDLRKQGLSIILISSEIEEIMGLCDRIIVMKDGYIHKEMDRETSNATQVVEAAFGR